jgi:acyl-CoA synthetase (AMP-forming)/AMP-acid ligase II
MLLTQALSETAIKYPSNLAVLDLGKGISYRDLRKKIGQLSFLYQSEILADAKVAILAENHGATVATFFALSNIRCPVFFLNPTETDEELIEDLKNLQINTILVVGSKLLRMRDIQRKAGVSFQIIELEKKRGGEYDESYIAPPERPVKENDPVLIVKLKEYSEPTKYIFFHHRQITSACIASRRFYRFTPVDRMLTTMHWSHPFALMHGMLLPILSGATCAIDPQCSSLEEFIEYIAKEKITRFCGPPKFFFQLLNFCASQKYTLPGVKSITVGMGSISLSLRKIYQMLKIPVLRSYGRHEMLWPVAMDALEEGVDIEKSKCRLATGVKVKVLNATGDEIPGPNKREGLLAVTADFVMSGFFHPDKEIAGEVTRNRLRGTWIYTGEIARLEGAGEDLSIAVLGKETDMIRVGNRFLSSREIDEKLKGFAGVADAAGFVRLDQKGEKEFSCAIVPQVKFIDEKAILAELANSLPGELVPKSIHIVESIPRDAFESVNRYSLQRQFSG